jgi:hypothetical protein
MALGAALEPDGWSAGLDRSLPERFAADRARVLARVGRRREAAVEWLAVAEAGGRLAAVAWLQVAKHREHWAGDLPGALHATDRAAAIASRARLTGWPLVLIERDVVRRTARLQRRIGGSVSREGALPPAPTVAASWAPSVA